MSLSGFAVFGALVAAGGLALSEGDIPSGALSVAVGVLWWRMARVEAQIARLVPMARRKR